MEATSKIPNMHPVIIEHNDMKLVGIPCIGLKDMGNKYHNAKESLFLSTKYLPQVLNHRIHYGMWVNSEIQKNPERHVYILCVEVSTFNGIPDWYVKLTVPAQKCVVVANEKGDFNAASEAVDEYVKVNHFKVSSEGRDYIVCERYSYDGEGFARYSLPIV
jgi:predicted transcriptional regulator YdeE